MLSINTNLSSLIAQHSMKQSTNKLNQAIERMTTGYKINHSKDNAANYSIATNMDTKLGALQVAEDNVLSGLDMVNTSSESLSLIEDKLTRLRALATQASNGTYGDKSLTAINAEASALVDELGRTYSTAAYNGIKVFKGTSKIEIPDGVGTTGNVGVQTLATSYGKFIDNPNTYEQSYVDSLNAVSSVVVADGFTESEYKIADVADLVKLAELVNDENLDTTGITFVLSSDIDLSSISNWTPIGDYSIDSNNIFKGSFDGNGHVIKNLQIDRDTKEYQGLFGYTDIGEIKNVGLEEGNVKGKAYVGGLVGCNLNSSITNSYATVDVSSRSSYGSSFVGGLVGRDNARGTVSNCYATGDVSGTGDYVGGLTGYSYYLDYSNCYATGNVSGRNCVGGLVGVNSGCDITNCYATGTVSGVDGVGGLMGSAGNNVYISNCNATGNVTGTSKVGGLVGSGYSGNLVDCYATGSVSGVDSIGGLMGYMDTFISEISNSYATGNVTGTSNVGGLVGYSIGFYIRNTYATGNVSGVNNVGGLMGYTDANEISNSYATGNVCGNGFVGGLAGQAYTSGVTDKITNCLSYSTVSGQDADSTGSLIGGAVVTNNNTSFGTLNITDCQAMSQDMNTIGGSYMYASSTYTLLDTYDMSTMLAGISVYKPEITSMTLQVGTSTPDSNQITFDMAFELDGFNGLAQIGLDTTTDFVKITDNLLSIVSAKQTEYGAVQNRLESALDEISTQYENLVSSRSTLQDADIAEVSSTYIKQQILQQASATLMATANQSPSIALQLI